MSIDGRDTILIEIKKNTSLKDIAKKLIWTQHQFLKKLKNIVI